MSGTVGYEFALPELKQIIGSMLFVRKEPLGVTEIRRVLRMTAERRGGVTEDFAKADEKEIRDALAELGKELETWKAGFHLIEVAGGWRLENDANCGPWLRVMLQKGRGARLSLPALETLAIIAYRQPCVRSEIEAVRGVAVDALLKNLLELQLIRVVGRSELPGRPWMFGTTQKFMEHFGLKCLDDLPGTEELRRLEEEGVRGGRRVGTEGAAEGGLDAGEMVESPNQMRLAVVEAALPDDQRDPSVDEAVGDADGEPVEREGVGEDGIVGGDGGGD